MGSIMNWDAGTKRNEMGAEGERDLTLFSSASFFLLFLFLFLCLISLVCICTYNII